jgi:hypothetical protein
MREKYTRSPIDSNGEAGHEGYERPDKKKPQPQKPSNSARKVPRGATKTTTGRGAQNGHPAFPALQLKYLKVLQCKSRKTVAALRGGNVESAEAALCIAMAEYRAECAAKGEQPVIV